MAIQTVKIDVALSGKNAARLAARSYEKLYTNIPNEMLPPDLKESLAIIYNVVCNEDLPLSDYTFTVRADAQGYFKRIYSPSLLQKEGEVVIQWGNAFIPVEFNSDEVVLPLANGKFKASFKKEKIDKFDQVCLTISFSKDGVVYIMPIPVRQKDFKNSLEVEAYEMLLSDQPESIIDTLAEYHEPTGGEYKKFEGPVIKTGYLPQREFTILDVRYRETPFGIKAYFQSVTDEEFTAPTKKKVGEVWQDENVLVNGFFQIEANNALNNLLKAGFNISKENVATLVVGEKGEYNGKPFAKCSLKAEVVEDDDSLDITF